MGLAGADGIGTKGNDPFVVSVGTCNAGGKGTLEIRSVTACAISRVP